ncbi:MAG: HAMP domain-containing histidine kinase, partial [Chitinophagaceae bacterium]
IIFICVVSFLVIGVATILFFINRYQNTNRERLSKSIRIMESELKSAVVLNRDSMNNTLSINQADRKAIESSIKRISEIHGTDVNLYDLNGRLLVSSLPLPYIKGIVSTMMNPVAFYHLHQNQEVQYFQKEEIGKLSYVSNYKPVIDENGDKYAYLNIPYFTSQEDLKEEISNFIVTIINLNAFIFLIAGVIALFITNRITRTFSLIGEKMKKINLEKRNEAITWTRSDEIGQLVAEYNKMVDKLNDSAQALAKTEREGAWREMAKQIAHEIKNPLTPMKLSMQYLQKAIEQGTPNIMELTNSVSKTLVEQIDHLSMIASEFSQFANIENARREDVDLNETLNGVLQLYSTNEQLELRIILLQQPLIVEADRTHINRIFTNLLQNAIQATPEDEKAIVAIEEFREGNSVIVRISDNGHGIDDTIREHIFTPNFTTKSSGTGLGLAMCKRMVEHARGKIWFQSETGKGTTFFVEFPLKD